ncbi:transcription initiation factor IID, TAF10 subunit [Tothia fuscella]|uniref:Transcription initiation factor TFIID subunit 10 n=1 Tax=Tothia fuscella TaxID=1048955 RepID=A0A9P4TVX7_9PEZI|nr:transcription initiation factor IID, TAF10 subunit [Tothia fuscella]
MADLDPSAGALDPADEEMDASIEEDIIKTEPDQTQENSVMDTTNDDPNNINNNSSSTMVVDGVGEVSLQQAQEARIPAKKDANLREFMGKMDEYAPIIPDAVTNYYLTLSGLPPPPQTPIQLTRLLSLATQKFIADIAADAYQYSRIRSSNTQSNNNPMGGTGAGAAGVGGPAGGAAPKESNLDKAKGGVNLGQQRPGFGGGGQGATAQGRTVLTMEDLGMAVGEYGVNVKRGEFYR